MGSDFYDSTISFSRSISRLAVSFACTRSLSRAQQGRECRHVSAKIGRHIA